MNLRRALLITILSCSAGGVLSAQERFYIGAAAGVFMNVPTDFETRQIKRRIYGGSLGGTKLTYYNYAFQQYDYTGSIAPQASLLAGYGIRSFGFQLGLDFLINIYENFVMVHPSTGVTEVFVSYGYSALHIPVSARYYFVNTEKFRLGISLGAYLSVPLTPITREHSGDNIFNLSDPADAPDTFDTNGYKKGLGANSKKITQDTGAGGHIGISGEAAIGRGAFTFDLGYKREFFNSINYSLLLGTDSNGMINPGGTASVQDNERKVTILSGIFLSLGYKYYIRSSSRPPDTAFSGNGAQTSDRSAEYAESEKRQTRVTVPSSRAFFGTRYYMIVAGNAEGPLSYSNLQNLAFKGILNGSTLIWRKGLKNWAAAEEFEELLPLFGKNAETRFIENPADTVGVESYTP